MASRAGTNRRVLRSLDHLWMGTNEKFARKLRPSYMQSQPPFVHPKDRIAFWNIVPGDVVKLRSGAVGHDEQDRQIRGEGIVTSVDRTNNRIWLRDLNDDNKRAPKNTKHVIPRLVDPEAGPEKGFSPNVQSVPRPVHYSKVMLKVPNTDMYASRIERSKPFFDKRKNMFCWKRFAVVKATTEEAIRAGRAMERIEVPWPKMPERRRPFNETHADGQVVQEETFVPWVPEDPVLLPMTKPRTTPANEAIAAERRAHWEAQLEKKRGAHNVSDAAPTGAKTYAGFDFKESIRPPPIAQAPSVSEMVRAEEERLAEFVRDDAVQAHLSNGGQVFTASDYLDIAPRVGPAAGGNWAALSTTATGYERDAAGRLAYAPSKREVDAMPIELLMTKDLANEQGRKWRMRRWKERQQVRAAEQAAEEAEREDLLRELAVLRVSK
ncbi:hypothetical protein MBRA1_000571 [Malassezia brasiliensis]|uniref:KOW domain-containing protein n=1 Tax=Malassezia brasiliensis TaxID=1821822 RepID=A0AAF0INN5_9BASI|nr:hypothetical protein MBRA1_000571 [Malassezia brasiliensis]